MLQVLVIVYLECTMASIMPSKRHYNSLVLNVVAFKAISYIMNIRKFHVAYIQ